MQPLLSVGLTPTDVHISGTIWRSLGLGQADHSRPADRDYGALINKVLKMWPSHFHQFRSYVMKMSDMDRDALLITDPKVVQVKIDSQPREKRERSSGCCRGESHPQPAWHMVKINFRG